MNLKKKDQKYIFFLEKAIGSFLTQFFFEFLGL